MIEAAEKAGIFQRRKFSHKTTSTGVLTPGNQYYFDYIHDTNNQFYRNLNTNKTQMVEQYLPYNEVIETKTDPKKRVQYYLNALPDEKDFKLHKDGTFETKKLLSVKPYNDIQI